MIVRTGDRWNPERTRRRARGPDAARRRGAAGLGAQRPGDHRRPAVVADQHPPHRRNARPRDRDRQRARVHPAADRRDPAPAGARRRRARRRAVAVVAAPRGRASAAIAGVVAVRRVRRLRHRRAADQHALRVPRRGDPVRVLRRRRVRLDAPRRGTTRAGAGGWPAALLVLAGAARLHPVASTARRTANWTNWPRQQRSKTTSLALVADGSITLRCGPVGVPNHAPIPLLALYLKTSPQNDRQRPKSARSPTAPTSTRRARKSKTTTCSTPTTRTLPRQRAAGLHRGRTPNRSWLIFERCP